MPLYRYQNLFAISFIDEYSDGFCFLLSHTMHNDHSHTDIFGYVYTCIYNIKW